MWLINCSFIKLGNSESTTARISLQTTEKEYFEAILTRSHSGIGKYSLKATKKLSLAPPPIVEKVDKNTMFSRFEKTILD
jgi:hypothetical protein